MESDSILISLPAPRTRRRHSPEFKARVIEACLQPGVSIAAVALANQLNTNFVRKWVKAHRERAQQEMSAKGDPCAVAPSQACAPTFVPVTVQTPPAESSSDIRIEIRRAQTVVQISWRAAHRAGPVRPVANRCRQNCPGSSIGTNRPHARVGSVAVSWC